MKRVILGFSLFLIVIAPVACRLGGGDNPEPQMQPVLTSEKTPSGVDPGLHVNTSPMEAGAPHSSMGAESMRSASDPMAPQGGTAAAMQGDKGMGPMTKIGDGAPPRAATSGRPMPMGKGSETKMDAGMPMDGGMKAGCCGDSPMRGGPAMPPPAASSQPMPGPASSQQPMPMAPMGHDGHM